MKKIATLMFSMILMLFAGLAVESEPYQEYQNDVIEFELVETITENTIATTFEAVPSIDFEGSNHSVYQNLTSPAEPVVEPDELIVDYMLNHSYGEHNETYKSPLIRQDQSRYKQALKL